jgi:hypothetical protein
MIGREELLKALRVRFATLLETFGAAIADRVPGINWRAELPASHIYDLAAVLTFFSADDPETELVAVTLELRDLTSGTWMIDVTDRESLRLTGHLAPLEQDALVDMGSVETAVSDIESILQSWNERIVRELAPHGRRA